MTRKCFQKYKNILTKLLKMTILFLGSCVLPGISTFSEIVFVLISDKANRKVYIYVQDRYKSVHYLQGL